jgi:TorA maturation chaperone TorD
VTSIDQGEGGIAEEDAARAQLYALLGRLLLAAPAADVLERLRGLAGEAGEVGEAIGALGAAARAATPESVAAEYDALFIGLVRGELVPYASYYLTGFLHEKPLARLRGDMARLGIARVETASEPEDHAGALCEMMAGLIAGAFGAPAGLAEQKQFFTAHLAAWAPRFFEDLEAAGAANFYKSVGRLGRRFLDVETQAFAMTA